MSAILAKFKSVGGLDGNGIALSNIADPTNDQDAATKAFVVSSVSAVVGGLQYQGTWNASTNTPALASGTGTQGFFYKVSVAGTTTLDGVSEWGVGDFALFDGTTWDRIANQDGVVTSVAGRTGDVTLEQADIGGLTTTDDVTFGSVTATSFTGDLVGNASSATTATTATTAGNVSGVVAIANGGTGAATATDALTALGAYPASNPNNYITAADVSANSAVTSVNGETGDVVLGQNNITGLNTTDTAVFAGVAFPQGSISTATLTTSATTAGQLLDARAADVVHVIKYVIQAVSSGAYSAVEVLLVSDGTNVTVNPYALADSGSGQLISIDATIDDGDVQLLVTPVNAVTTINAAVIAING